MDIYSCKTVWCNPAFYSCLKQKMVLYRRICQHLMTLLVYCSELCGHSLWWNYVVFLSGSESVQVFYLFFSFLYMYSIAMEIQLSRGEGWDLIDRFNIATSMCLSQARTWISNVICHGLIICSMIMIWSGRWLHLVDISGIVDYNCLSFLFKIHETCYC